MWKTIRAAFRAYLVAIGRHPIGYPLAGAMPPVAIGYGLRAQARTLNKKHTDDFDPAGWPELV